jgi:hypothetical protein
MHQGSIRMIMRFVCLGLLALIIAGCGESIGTVSGEVKVKGKDKDEPLPAGLISFISQGRKKGVFTGEIKNGKYTVTGVTTGKAIITIQGAAPPEKVAPKEKDNKPKEVIKVKPKGKAEPKPPTAQPKYANPKTSGLEYEVTVGEQTHDIVLDP